MRNDPSLLRPRLLTASPAVAALLSVAACSPPEGSSWEEESTPQVLERIAALSERLENDPFSPELFYTLCADYWTVGDLNSAQKCYEELLATDARVVPARIDLAQILVHRGRYVRAVPHLEAFLADTGEGEPGREWAVRFLSVYYEIRSRTSTLRSDAVGSTNDGVGRNSLGMTFIHVPGGSFSIGRKGGPADESPAHRVEISPFRIGKLEVTRREYWEFERETAYHRPAWGRSGAPAPPEPSERDLPVYASWYDARAFAIWLSLRQKAVYRLPSEAEWEFAARGFDERPNPWGGEPGTPGHHGNWDRFSTLSNFPLVRRPAFPLHERVGSFPAGRSAFGALDMAGNVREWCLDGYDPQYYGSSFPVDPFGPVEPRAQRVQRGVGWRDSLRTGHATVRFSADPVVAHDHFGFRLVKETGDAPAGTRTLLR